MDGGKSSVLELEFRKFYQSFRLFYMTTEISSRPKSMTKLGYLEILPIIRINSTLQLETVEHPLNESNTERPDQKKVKLYRWMVKDPLFSN